MANKILQNQPNNTNARARQRAQLKKRYFSARYDIIFIILFTAINIFYLISERSGYRVFSASIPYILADYGKLLCGMYPDEYYSADFTPLPPSVLWVFITVAVLILGLYLVFFLLSKNGRSSWLVAAVVFFSIDTLVLFIYYELNGSIILDLIMHAVIIYSMISGIRANTKLKAMPPEEENKEREQDSDGISTFDEGVDSTFDSKIIRLADYTVTSRKLLEFESNGHKVVYRRVKRVCELIIDGKVYAECAAALVKDHMLTAVVGGHTISVGYENSKKYGMVDGTVVVEK